MSSQAALIINSAWHPTTCKAEMVHYKHMFSLREKAESTDFCNDPWVVSLTKQDIL